MRHAGPMSADRPGLRLATADDAPAIAEIYAPWVRDSIVSFELEPPHILYGRGQPRLICTALGEGGEQVSRLQGLLTDELRRVLPALDLRPKPPHVTLARFNRKASRQTARKVEEALSRQLDPGQTLSDDLSSVSLVKSSLTPSGPIYESLGEASLS